MEEEDQYGGMPDLRQYIAARPNFFPPPEFLPSHRPPNPYDLLVFRSDSTGGGGGSGGGFESGGGAGRWPRQETLTLLEIRSRLDPKFKEANQKGPLWDEVSRIMSEEHGYQRSGKKCREKFENLYKYYKKTKEGKAGRQDGKHYRFFRQLEALYGDTTTTTTSNNYSLLSISASASEPYHPQMNFPNNENGALVVQRPRYSDNTSLSLSNCSEPDTSSSDEPKSKKRLGKMGWKARVKDFVDLQMKRLIEKQEAWMEKMVAAVEHKERERALREEEWRKQDAERVEREHRFWAGERAWIEARDAALMEALHKITGKDLMAAGVNVDDVVDRNKIEGLSTTGSVSWEEVGNKMSRLGHDRKDKLDCVDINNVIKCNKKRKENSKSYGFFNGDDIPNRDVGVGYEQQGFIEPIMRLSDNQSNNNNNNNNISESCLRYYMGDAYGRII